MSCFTDTSFKLAERHTGRRRAPMLRTDVPDWYGDPLEIPVADLTAAAEAFATDGADEDTWEWRMHNYKRARVGFAHSVKSMMTHEEAVDWVSRACVCAHDNEVIDRWRNTHRVLGTWENLATLRCRKCGHTVTQVTSRNNYSGD